MDTHYRVFVQHQESLDAFLSALQKGSARKAGVSVDIPHWQKALCAPLFHANHYECYVGEFESKLQNPDPPKNFFSKFGIVRYDEVVVLDGPRLRVIEAFPPLHDAYLDAVVNTWRMQWRGKIFRGTYPVVNDLNYREDCYTTRFTALDTEENLVSDLLRQTYGEQFAFSVESVKTVAEF